MYIDESHINDQEKQLQLAHAFEGLVEPHDITKLKQYENTNKLQ